MTMQSTWSCRLPYPFVDGVGNAVIRSVSALHDVISLVERISHTQVRSLFEIDTDPIAAAI
jgi:hypothetical protein